MAVTGKELEKVSAIVAEDEWVNCDTTLGDIYELVTALKASGIEYSLVPGSHTLLVRAWVDHAINTYIEMNMDSSCTLTDFLSAYKEAK